MSDQFSALLDEGIKPLFIAVCAHEVGHGLAWRAAGFPVGRIEVRRGLFGGVSGGYCDHNAGGRVTKNNVRGFLIGCAAGAVAQKRCARLYLSGRHGSGGESADRDEFDYMVDAWADRVPKMSWGTAKSHAASLLSSHARRLDALTIRLSRSGRLSGV